MSTKKSSWRPMQLKGRCVCGNTDVDQETARVMGDDHGIVEACSECTEHGTDAAAIIRQQTEEML